MSPINNLSESLPKRFSAMDEYKQAHLRNGPSRDPIRISAINMSITGISNLSESLPKRFSVMDEYRQVHLRNGPDLRMTED